MKRFLSDTEVMMRIPMPSEFRTDFDNVLSFQRRPVGTIGTDDISCFSDHDLQVPHSSTRSVFNSSELKQMFMSLYPTCRVLNNSTGRESIWQH